MREQDTQGWVSWLVSGVAPQLHSARILRIQMSFNFFADSYRTFSDTFQWQKKFMHDPIQPTFRICMRNLHA
eukprot:COSAG05_NODE_2980_length_2439_cov_12.469658_3_plen_72_part_00